MPLSNELQIYDIASMTEKSAALHLYQRTVTDESQDSLAIVASLIGDKQEVLDLGMGAGGLGQRMREKVGVVSDGVTFNPVEAEIARNSYRHTWVADLEQASLHSLVQGKTYDSIVCADVLEHIKEPKRILNACKGLLKLNGRLLVSIPNASYCGLIAELIEGEFRYRTEGLMDATHVRFFTRRSFERFAEECGWEVVSVRTTSRTLPESEFRTAFDGFPPAVSRYLVTLPDAFTYQFIYELRPNFEANIPSMAPPTTAVLSHSRGPDSGTPHFSAQLYLAKQGTFNENAKISVAGKIGVSPQELTFSIPRTAQPYTGLRLDPADRPGYFRLFEMQLIRHSDQALCWDWKLGRDSLELLLKGAYNDISACPSTQEVPGDLLLLLGDDPWIELPLDSEALGAISEGGYTFMVRAGWPMSADYMQACTTARSLQIELSRLRNELQASHEESKRHLKNFHQTAGCLKEIEESRIFRWTRPLVQLKILVDRLLSRQRVSPQEARHSQTILEPVSKDSDCIDIIVPVFKGMGDTVRCIEAVLGARCVTRWQLIIINDCSPEPELQAWLRAAAQNEPRITLLENSENIGFVATVNRGMSLCDTHDVLLLNSDTEVANNWLDRLRTAAYNSDRVGTVTPFSNNATIFSYPHFCCVNEMPDGWNTTELDGLFAKNLAGQTLEVPTAVGFCMYIRRACLREVGLFDVENFGKGYGEENDFCIRAQHLGWHHLHALDTFVRHVGGVSFGEAKSAHELRAIDTLRRLHPNYESDVHNFLQRDPAAMARQSIDVARSSVAPIETVI